MKKTKVYKTTAVLKHYPSDRATWYVVTLDRKIGQSLYVQYATKQGGFGSLPVIVTLGKTTWQTSIFRDNSVKSYILFIKASVRKDEGVTVGDTLNFKFSLRW